MAASHVKLVDAENGKRYALPEVGEAPEYAVPTRAFRAEEIIARRLHLLVWTEENGWEKQLDKTTGEPSHTEKPVAGFLDSTKCIRRYGNLGLLANEAGMVTVILGDEPRQEEFESTPCGDVSGVRTPRSDESDPELERFCIR